MLRKKNLKEEDPFGISSLKKDSHFEIPFSWESLETPFTCKKHD